MTQTMTADQLGGAITTFTGRVFRPLLPEASKVNIIDIAHALSNNCRFTGHVKTFYSVAEHSVRVSEILPPRFKLWGLLHDASEAYLSDIARPVKRAPGFGEVYREVEARLMEVVAEHFDLPYPEPPQVKAADGTLLAAEQRDLMPRHRHEDGAEAYPEVIEPWTPQFAEEMFLKRYEEYTGIKPRR